MAAIQITRPVSTSRFIILLLTALALALGPSSDLLAHNVSREDAELVAGRSGAQVTLYVWLGAKHMVTGYDHVLFLVGVLYYIRSLRSVATFVTLFALGHSITLIGGILARIDVSPYLVDAIIGISVAYKGFDNLSGFAKLFGAAPDERVAVFIFGLFHGLGLATKLQNLALSEDGLLANLIAFNVGVELGQLAALVVILLVLRLLPTKRRRSGVGMLVNTGLVIAGLGLMAWQLHSFFTS